MRIVLSEVKQRTEELERVIERKKRELERLAERLPKGMIRTTQHGDVFQYYFRENSSEKNGIYIPRKKEKVAAEYALMEYCEKVISSAERELAILNRIISFYENNIWPEKVYEKMSLGKRKLIDPIWISDEEYVKRWLKENDTASEYREEGKIFETSFGEKVRSKSEVLISELYHRKGIPYIYEKPLEFKGLATFRPDFTFLDVRRRVEIYHEHLGLIDDEEYRNNALQKIRLYEKNGYHIGDRLLVTCETQRNPLDIKTVERSVTHLLRKKD